jgi:hypothetical protein
MRAANGIADHIRMISLYRSKCSEHDDIRTLPPHPLWLSLALQEISSLCETIAAVSCAHPAATVIRQTSVVSSENFQHNQNSSKECTASL